MFLMEQRGSREIHSFSHPRHRELKSSKFRSRFQSPMTIRNGIALNFSWIRKRNGELVFDYVI